MGNNKNSDFIFQPRTGLLKVMVSEFLIIFSLQLLGTWVRKKICYFCNNDLNWWQVLENLCICVLILIFLITKFPYKSNFYFTDSILLKKKRIKIYYINGNGSFLKTEWGISTGMVHRIFLIYLPTQPSPYSPFLVDGNAS